MTLIQLISAVSGVLAAGVAGWFTYLTKKASSQSPESVAGGYSRLVGDMRTQQDSLVARVQDLESQRFRDHRRIQILGEQVAWLLDLVTPEQRADFDAKFQLKPDQTN